MSQPLITEPPSFSYRGNSGERVYHGMSQANQNVLCSAVVKAAGLPPNSTEHLGHRMASRQTYHVVRMGWVGINGGQ